MRLLPRFSLRFLWIALTIFLIVFGVGVKYWKNYQAHEEVAEALETLGFDVEEEIDTLFGHTYAKRITGLAGSFTNPNVKQVTQCLRNLPDKQKLKRLSCKTYSDLPAEMNPPLHNAVEIEQLYQAIGQLTEVEVLDLDLANTSTAALLHLGKLRQLNSLKFHFMDLPEQGLRTLLNQLPDLRELYINTLNSTPHLVGEIEGVKLPKLEVLFLCDRERVARLNLTKAGFGNIPQLRFLILHGMPIERIEFEAGALPQLKILDLSEAADIARVDWQQLPLAAPQLSGLGIHLDQVTPKCVMAIGQIKQLNHLYLGGRRDIVWQKLRPLLGKHSEKSAEPEEPFSPELTLLLGDGVQPVYYEYLDLWLSVPREEFRFETWPSWNIKQYRTMPQPVGFF